MQFESVLLILSLPPMKSDNMQDVGQAGRLSVIVTNEISDQRNTDAMKTRLACRTLVILFFVSISSVSSAKDDRGFDLDSLKIVDQVLLKSGETLSGTILKIEDDRKAPVSFRTSDGVDLVLERKLISKVVKTDEVSQRYNGMISELADDAASHRDMVTWCKQQDNGSIRFKRQIVFHNKQIIRFEPNDAAARRELDYKFLKDENRWVPENQFWTSQGYVRSGAKWIPRLRHRIDQNKDQANEVYSARKQKLNLWSRNLRKMSAAEAIASLLAIAEPNLMPDIYANYQEETNPAIKAVYIEVFASARPLHNLQIKGLVDAVINLNSDKALDYLMQEDFNKRLASEYLTSFLQNKSNLKINRAAFALGELQSRYSILALANALITKHKVAQGDPGRMSTSFNNVTGGSQQFGTKKIAPVPIQNVAVLDALKKITEQDLGYSKTAYQRWYIKNYTVVGLKARR